MIEASTTLHWEPSRTRVRVTPLQGWQVDRAEKEASFNIPMPAGDSRSPAKQVAQPVQATVWRIAATNERSAIDQALRTRNAQLADVDKGLNKAERLLRAEYGFAINAPLPEPSFSIPTAAERGRVAIAYDNARADLESLLGWLRQMLRYPVYIETERRERLLGLTRFNWLGDVDVVLAGQVSAETKILHQKNVRHALHAHHTNLRRFMLIASAALQLGVLLTGPQGTLMTLPKAWRLANEIVDEFMPKT